MEWNISSAWRTRIHRKGSLNQLLLLEDESHQITYQFGIDFNHSMWKIWFWDYIMRRYLITCDEHIHCGVCFPCCCSLTVNCSLGGKHGASKNLIHEQYYPVPLLICAMLHGSHFKSNFAGTVYSLTSCPIMIVG